MGRLAAVESGEDVVVVVVVEVVEGVEWPPWPSCSNRDRWRGRLKDVDSLLIRVVAQPPVIITIIFKVVEESEWMMSGIRPSTLRYVGGAHKG